MIAVWRLMAIAGAALALAGLGGIAPAGADARLTIYESALNKFAEDVGTVSGTGSDAFSGLVGDYEWELSDFSFAIDSDGIRFEADLNARWPVGSFDVFSYTTTISGSATFVVSNNQAELSVPSVSFPLVFDVPFVGPVTLLTVTTELPFRFTAPVQPVLIPDLSIVAMPIDTEVDYLQDRVRISTKVLVAKH